MEPTQNDSTQVEQMNLAQTERKEDLREFQNELVHQDQELHEDTGEVAPVDTVEDWEPSDAQPTGDPQEVPEKPAVKKAVNKKTKKTSSKA